MNLRELVDEKLTEAGIEFLAISSPLCGPTVVLDTTKHDKEIRADERVKTIDEVIRFISTHVYGWQDLRDFLEQMKGGTK